MGASAPHKSFELNKGFSPEDSVSGFFRILWSSLTQARSTSILNHRTRGDRGVVVLQPRVNRPGLKGEDAEAHDVQEGKQSENNPRGVVAGAYEDFAERDKDAREKSRLSE